MSRTSRQRERVNSPRTAMRVARTRPPEENVFVVRSRNRISSTPRIFSVTLALILARVPARQMRYKLRGRILLPRLIWRHFLSSTREQNRSLRSCARRSCRSLPIMWRRHIISSSCRNSPSRSRRICPAIRSRRLRVRWWRWVMRRWRRRRRRRRVERNQRPRRQRLLWTRAEILCQIRTLKLMKMISESKLFGPPPSAFFVLLDGKY